MDIISHYWKAIIAFIAPGAVVIGASVQESSPMGELITQGEWVTAIVAAVVTGAGVAVKSNGPSPADGRHEAQPLP